MSTRRPLSLDVPLAVKPPPARRGHAAGTRVKREPPQVKGRNESRNESSLLVSGLVLVVSPAVALASGAPSHPGATDNQGTQTAAANEPRDSGQTGQGACLQA